ncbi:MAG: MATE family efflux transporter [Roseburia sp.]|nr:MATE family efflux transporter [Roseburia sp.]
MSKTKTLDMTTGNPLPLLIKFSIPLVLGSIFQQLYSFVDTAIVGRCISVQALSAVGVTGALNFLVLGLTMGCAMGFGIPISQSVGAGNKEDISRYFWNGLYLCLGIGLVISIGVSIFVEPLLVMMNTPAELLDMAVSYLRIIFMGQITTVLYNYFAAVLRAFGDSKRPFYFLLVASVLNIILDLVFILVIPMGVAGAALATVISQGVSVMLSVWWLLAKMNVIHKSDDNGDSWTKMSKEHMKTACIIGVPLGLEYSVTSIGNVILQSSINSMGAVVAAAQICGERIRAIATMPMENVGMAIATYTGQNYGAKRLDRIKAGVKAGMIINVAYCAAAWLVLFVLKKPLVYLLLGEVTSIEAVKSIEYLTVITTLFVFHGSLMIFRNTVQGMGYSASALAASVMEIIGRSGAGVLAVYFNSFFIICVSSPSAWILAMIMCIILYGYYMRKEEGEMA